MQKLAKPQPYNAVNYVLDVNTPGTIQAVGYGTLRRDYPLELMTFERRAPGDFDVVIGIHYCGVCHSDWHIARDEWKRL